MEGGKGVSEGEKERSAWAASRPLYMSFPVSVPVTMELKLSAPVR